MSTAVTVLLSLMVLLPTAAQPTPCNEMARPLRTEERRKLAETLARRFQVPQVDILARFASGEWTVLYVDMHESDEVFLFFRNDPLSSEQVTEWSGAARIDEQRSIEEWSIKNAPGIPRRLAKCFAWYATMGRAQEATPSLNGSND